MYNFFSIHDSAPVSNKEHSLIQSSLSEGMFLLDAYFVGKGRTPPSVEEFFDKILAFQKQIMADFFLDNPDNFKIQQNNLYDEIYSHKNNFPDVLKLFFEFLLGLCRFSLSIKIYEKFYYFLISEKLIVQPIVSIGLETLRCLCEYCCENLFWNYFHNISLMGKQNIISLMEITKDFSTINFWQSAQAFFSLNHKIKLLAQYLASMHYIPSEKKFLRLAQMLHWGGFGGSGELIHGYPQLQPLLDHRIGYHDKEKGGFNSRLSILLAQLNDLKNYASDVSLRLLLDSYQRGATLKILDVGSGPSYLGVASIIHRLSEQGRHTELTASEVDPNSIIQLKANQNILGSPLVDVRYFDLNFPEEISESEIIKDEFDVICASLVLHQLSFQEINNALKFFARIVKPGGYILNPDVSVDGYYQALLVPANMVDREGYVKSWQQHNFLETSVPYSETQSKILFPLREKSGNFPNVGLSVYAFIVYKVCLLPTENIERIALFWKNQQYEEANKLVEHYFPRK